MMTAEAALRQGMQRLKELESGALDARLLLEHTLGCTREQLLVSPERELSPPAAAAYDALIARRAAREPLSQIIGQREFWGLPFKVTRDTLTPRPDTETVVEAVLERLTADSGQLTRNKNLSAVSRQPSAAPRILDLGTGTGCLLLSLLHVLQNATGTGADISPAALAVARENAKALGLDGRAEFVLSRWCEKIAGKYDIIVANPPYIASNAVAALMPEVAQYEPHLALDGGADGLACYREIARQLPPYMATPEQGKAIVALEIGAGQETPVAAIFEAEGFRVESLVPDLAGIPRCLVMSLT